MITISSAEDAYLEGLVEFQAWMEDFEARFYSPLGMTLLGSAMASATPEQLETLRAMNPEAYDRLMEVLNGGKIQIPATSSGGYGNEDRGNPMVG